MEPSAAIAVIENNLRRLIQAILLSGSEGGALTDHLNPDTLATLEERRTEEGKRRSPASVPSSLLAYTHFYELRGLIEKNWQKFAPALGHKKEFTVLADKVEDYRNAPSHSRELLPYERSLLEGIAGTLRTQVTTYLSSQSPDRKHYPVMESARDSFGIEVPDLDSPKNTGIAQTGIRLQIGDQVTFNCRGWDAQGRELTWKLRTLPDGKQYEVGTGEELSFTWTATQENVAAQMMVEITMTSSGPYHRGQLYDSRVYFVYAVDPPDLDEA